MIISVGIDYPICDKSLLVEIQSPGNNITIDLSQMTKKVSLEFDLPICNQTVDLGFCCSDINIVNYPLTVTNIVLDCFYQSAGILYKGIPKFDNQFIELIKNTGRDLEPAPEHCNKLDFTGQLVYTFIWPFYKNIFE